MFSCWLLLQWRTATAQGYSQTWPSQSSMEPCTELRLRCSAIEGKTIAFGFMSSFCNFDLFHFYFDQTVTNGIWLSIYTSSNNFVSLTSSEKQNHGEQIESRLKFGMCVKCVYFQLCLWQPCYCVVYPLSTALGLLDPEPGDVRLMGGVGTLSANVRVIYVLFFWQCCFVKTQAKAENSLCVVCLQNNIETCELANLLPKVQKICGLFRCYNFSVSVLIVLVETATRYLLPRIQAFSFSILPFCHHHLHLLVSSWCSRTFHKDQTDFASENFSSVTEKCSLPKGQMF